MEDIQVSISCITYNQEDYIRDALEGFVMQKTNFAYEVLIHDDASTDGTADIIREYEKKYPNLIKPIYQTENQHSKGAPVSDFNYKRAKGKYVALCEGDDYWTDPYKLQKQFDAMERHPEVDICNHATRRVHGYDNRCLGVGRKSNKETVFTFEQILLTPKNRVADTCSTFFRKSILDNEYEFWKVSRGSRSLFLIGAIGGGILYLPDCMATYRVCAKGSWTERAKLEAATDKNRRKTVETGINRKKWLFDILNKDTGYQYNEAFQKAKLALELEALGELQDYKTMRQPKYKEALKYHSRFYITKVWACKKFPCLWKVRGWIKK